MKKILLLLSCIFAIQLSATTWDEPWQDSIIIKAQSFVLAKVISCNENDGVKIKITKVLAGKAFDQKEITITKFSQLHLCSRSAGEGPEFHVRVLDSCYFFLSTDDKGNFMIATPTSGFAEVRQGSVIATYRHSYHQASVPPVVYEKTMTGIFNHYHGLAYNEAYFDTLITTYLSMKPAGFDPSEINTFFMQHVALESIYHLKIPGKLALILPFLHDKNNFHNQVSAARAMSACNSDEGKKELLKMISDKDCDGFVKVMCIRSLASFRPVEMKQQLQDILPKLSTEGSGFGGNIMDPRVCTSLPSPEAEMEKLLKTL